jgi:hypothetical protein
MHTNSQFLSKFTSQIKGNLKAMIKKLVLALVVLGFSTADVDAQIFRKKKRPSMDVEKQDERVDGFDVNGFARDADKRNVRARAKKDEVGDGFGDNRPAMSREEKRFAAKQKSKSKKTGVARNRDIETLMTDLTLAKIQKPVFRGILTEHLRDIEAIMSREDIDNAEKNVLLKQVYALRNKRLNEVLNDDQNKIWMRIKDQDEYLELARPEDI